MNPLPIITGQGVSSPEIRHFVAPYILEKVRPRVVLDLGCGIGVYGALLHQADPGIAMIGVDGFLPYLWQAGLREHYIARIHADLREVTAGRLQVAADLRICMDVIEHFAREEAVALLGSLPAPTIISTPLFDYRQGEVGGNALERHRCVFTEGELNALGYKTLHLVHHRSWDGQEGMMGAFEGGRGKP